MRIECSGLGFSHSCAEQTHGSGLNRLENHWGGRISEAPQTLHGLVTWVTTLEDIFAGRRHLISVCGQLFEAGAAC